MFVYNRIMHIQPRYSTPQFPLTPDVFRTVYDSIAKIANDFRLPLQLIRRLSAMLRLRPSLELIYFALGALASCPTSDVYRHTAIGECIYYVEIVYLPARRF